MPEIIFKQVHEMLSARHTHHTGKSLTYKKWRKIMASYKLYHLLG